MTLPPPDTGSIGPVEAYWRYRAWTVPITLVVGILAGLAVLATSGTSTATTTLYLTDPRGTPVFRDGSSTPTDLNRYARQRAEFAGSAVVRARVVESIEAQRADALEQDPDADESELPDPETLETLDDAVSAGTTTSSDVRIECTSESDRQALLICDEIVAAYLDLTEQDIVRRADATVDAFLGERERLVEEDGGAATIDQIDLQIAEVRSEAALLGNGVEFVEPAEVEEDSRILPALQYAIAALLFAAFAMAALAWFRAGRRPVISTNSDATGTLRAPLLGEITTAPAQVFDPVVPPGAAYQLLATSLGAVLPHGGVVLAASPTPNHDEPDTVARLAVAAAREGRRVLAVDANLRDRRLSRLFGFEQAVGGLTEMLAGLSTLDDVRRRVGVGGEASLDVVTGGRPVDDPAGLFRSQAARSTIASLRGRYDLVLVDAPPLLAVADGSALASETDGVILLVERGADAHDLDTVRQRLEVLRADLIGVVYDHRQRDHGR